MKYWHGLVKGENQNVVPISIAYKMLKAVLNIYYYGGVDSLIKLYNDFAQEVSHSSGAENLVLFCPNTAYCLHHPSL